MKVENSNELLLQSLKQRQGGQDKSSSVSKNSGLDSDTIDLTKPVRIGQTVIYVALNKSLNLDGQSFKSNASAVATSDSKVADDEETVQPTADNPLGFDYKKVAKNVLGFVTGAIRRAQADGADDSKLTELLGQARKGIDQGFGDARDELKGMGLFSEDLDKGITKSYDLIQDGLGKFEEELFGKAADEAAESTASGATQTPSTTPQTTSSDGNQNISVQGLAAAFSGRQSASLELATKEGDKITISFDQQESWKWQQARNGSGVNRKALEAYGDNSSGNGKSEYATSRTRSDSLYYSHSVGFSFSVEGNLNTDELKAIGGLVDQVGSLSDSFFSGDLQGALDQAKSLSWDDSQLVSFSLDLKQSQSAAVASTASGAASQGADGASATDKKAKDDTQGATASVTPELSQLFGPFADYLDRLQSMIEEANTLFDQKEQDQLAQWVVGQQQGTEGETLAQQSDSFISFNERMHKALQGLMA